MGVRSRFFDAAVLVGIRKSRSDPYVTSGSRFRVFSDLLIGSLTASAFDGGTESSTSGQCPQTGRRVCGVVMAGSQSGYTPPIGSPPHTRLRSGMVPDQGRE